MCEIKQTGCNEHSLVIDHNNGEYVCAKCGLVVREERFKRESGWKPK